MRPRGFAAPSKVGDGSTSVIAPISAAEFKGPVIPRPSSRGTSDNRVLIDGRDRRLPAFASEDVAHVLCRLDTGAAGNQVAHLLAADIVVRATEFDGADGLEPFGDAPDRG